VTQEIAKALDIKAGETVYVFTDDVKVIIEKKKR